MGTLVQDVRYGLRMLVKSPGFTAVAVVTLALGIGANTAIFSLINGVMLRSLPVRDPNQLVLFQWTAHRNFINGEYSGFGDCGGNTFQGSSGCSFPLPIFKKLQAQTGAFSGVLACAGPADLDLSGHGPATTVSGEIVSGDYFSTLGVGAYIGRTLGTDDDLPPAPAAVVLSYAYWQSAFGGSPSVLGQTIQLNKVPFTIVGVAQPSFTNLSPGKTQDMWLTIAMVPRLQIDWGTNIDTMGNWWLLVMARLKPGVPVGQGQAAASLVFRNEILYGTKPFAKAADDPEIVATPAQDALVGDRGHFSSMLYALMFAVGVVLLIACANVAGLLLARSTGRRKEMALRLALGANRATIIRQLLTESVLLSLLGGVIGIVVAFWGLHAITALITGNSSGHFPYVVSPDWRVLTFALGICVLTGILFGLAPAFRNTRLDLTPALKENASSVHGSGSGPGHFRLGSALVIAQVALSVVVLIGAGLLVRTLQNLRNIDPGFNVRNLLIFEIEPGRLGYTDARVRSLFSGMRDRLAATPGVDSVAYSSVALLMGDEWSTEVHIEGQPEKPETDVDMLAAGPEFLRTMRIPLVEGRAFTPEDFAEAEQIAEASKNKGADAPAAGTQTASPAEAGKAAPVINVLVNETFVRQYYPHANPLGKNITQGHGTTASGSAWPTHPSSEWQIVGVIGDTKYNTLRRKTPAVVYLPFTSSYGGYFELRTAGDPHALVQTVRTIATDIDPQLPLSRITTQTEQIDDLISQERQVARLSGFFALLALVLACVGLYGLLSYEVSRRTREIGVRMALGAQTRDVLKMVVRQGLWLACLGIAIGIAVALGLTRYLDAMLYGVHANDPITMIVVAVLLAAVAVAACYLPARRATNVDPMVALRYE